MMWQYGTGGWFHMMWMFPLVLLVAMFFWGGGSRSSCDKKQESARDILDKRYARGEIEQEEYQRKKKELE